MTDLTIGERIAAMTDVTPYTVAALLDGGLDTDPADKILGGMLDRAGLVVLFGLSDDLIELRGAVYIEIDAYQGLFREGDRQDLRFGADGLIPDHSIEMDENFCEMPEDEKAAHIEKIAAMTGPKDSHIDVLYNHAGLFWAFRTDIPHTVFNTTLHGNAYCRGIVFRLADATEAARRVRDARNRNLAEGAI